MFRRTSSHVLLCSAAAAATPAAAAAAAAAPPAGAASADTRKQIQYLRARTDAPILDCKKALVACNGDIEECVKWLSQKGLASADKKVDRVTSFGLVSVAVARNLAASAATAPPLGAVAFQLCTETDFSARNEKFLQLADEIRAESEALIREGKWEALQNEKNFADHFQRKIKGVMANISENISVKRAVPLELGSPSLKGPANQIGFYVHGSTPVAPHAGSVVAVSFVDAPDSADRELAADIAQTCVANFFLGDGTSVLDYSMLSHSDKSVKQHAAENKASLRRVLMLSAAGDEPRDFFF